MNLTAASLFKFIKKRINTSYPNARCAAGADPESIDFSHPSGRMNATEHGLFVEERIMYRPCPLCLTPEPVFFYRGPQRNYLRCRKCGLIYVPRDELLAPEEEKARYDLHENDASDPGYRKFLQQLTRPLLARIEPPPQFGLDFGSGPGPVLAQMLEARGYPMTCYDPYYAPNTDALDKTYDFVTCSEVVEHFNQPAREWRLLLNLLKPGGWLGIMTTLVNDLDQFPEMHYITDATHVSFYSRQTFDYLASQRAVDVTYQGDKIILIHKPGHQQETNPS